MPWETKKQERWGNSPTGRKKMGAATVAEFNQATKRMGFKKTRFKKKKT